MEVALFETVVEKFLCTIQGSYIFLNAIKSLVSIAIKPIHQEMSVGIRAVRPVEVSQGVDRSAVWNDCHPTRLPRRQLRLLPGALITVLQQLI